MYVWKVDGQVRLAYMGVCVRVCMHGKVYVQVHFACVRYRYLRKCSRVCGRVCVHACGSMVCTCESGHINTCALHAHIDKYTYAG